MLISYGNQEEVEVFEGGVHRTFFNYSGFKKEEIAVEIVKSSGEVSIISEHLPKCECLPVCGMLNRFLLKEGYKAKDVVCTLSSDGILTIEAARATQALYFRSEDICVKITNRRIYIDAEDHNQHEHGYMCSKLNGRYKLPKGYDSSDLMAFKSIDATLTIMAPPAQPESNVRKIHVISTGPHIFPKRPQNVAVNPIYG